MPYITSIERIAKKEGLEQGLKQGLEQGREQGREEGLLVGKIQVLQQVLTEPIESRDTLLGQPIDQLLGKLKTLQQRFDSRR